MLVTSLRGRGQGPLVSVADRLPNTTDDTADSLCTRTVHGMTQRGDSGWSFQMGSRTVIAAVIVVGGIFILVSNPSAAWIGGALLVLGVGMLALLYVAYRRGKY